jgi:hypothetical protein
MLLEGNTIFWGRFVKYVFCYLGAPLTTSSENAAFGFGIAGTVIFVIFVAKFHSKAINCVLSPFVWLGVLAILSAILSGIGRGRLGPLQALESRYVALSNFLWIGNLVFLSSLAIGYGVDDKRVFKTTLKRLVPVVIGVAIVGLACINAVAGSQSAAQRQSFLMPARNELLMLEDERLLGRLFPNVSVLKQRAATLREHHLSVYR